MPSIEYHGYSQWPTENPISITKPAVKFSDTAVDVRAALFDEVWEYIVYGLDR